MLRISSIESGATLFSTNMALCGLALPRPGYCFSSSTFSAMFRPTFIRCQSLVWDTLTSREVHPGLRTQQRVSEIGDGAP
jgi:hypothetical protein